jgi:alpha-tubulin suppressor-like RCC1 family protein
MWDIFVPSTTVLVRHRNLILVTTIIALSGVLVAQRVTADSSGASTTQADGSSTQIAALARYVDAGGSHTCVVLDDFSLKCFGSNSSGQIGSGGTASLGDAPAEMGDALLPVNLGTGRTVRAVSTGTAHTCALLDDATIRCFGEGDAGRLGRGSTADVGRTAASMGNALLPINLGAGRTAKAIATGAAHTCALLDDDSVKCWGSNDDGQLGLGGTDPRGDDPDEMGDNLPSVSLGLPTGVRVTAIAAGDAHTCALLSNGTVKCWGSGGNGRLGSGDELSRGDEADEMGVALPVVNVGSGRTVKAITAGAAHTCALRDTNDVVCWGYGSSGRLGSGNGNDLGDSTGEMGAALVPVALGTGRTAVALSAGASHTCAVLDNATAKCWGDGADGRTGNGTQNNLGDQPDELGDSLSAISLGTGRTVRKIVAGASHTCAVLDDATLKCFGLASNGRIGSGGSDTLGDAASEMGDNLPAVNLGTDRRVLSLTEPGRAGTPTGTAGDGTVSLTWSAPSSTGNSAITDYVVQYTSDGAEWVTVSDGVSASLSATVSGLTNATAYRFRITARNAIGDGAPSLMSDSLTPTVPTTTTTTTTTVAPTTTTTTVAPTTTTTTTTVAPTTTTVAPTTTSTTTTAPEPAPVSVTPATTIAPMNSTTSPTTNSPTTTVAPISTTTIAPTTTTVAPTTTTVVSPALTARTMRSLVLRPFPPLSTTLSPAQRRQIASFAASLEPSDSVTCVGGAGAGPLRVLRDLARTRAAAVCTLLAQRVPGVRTQVNIALSGEVQIIEPSTPLRIPASDLQRRVLVVARPGE